MQDSLSKINNFDPVFEKEQEYYSRFLHDIVSAHKRISQELLELNKNLSSLNAKTAKWESQMNEIDILIKTREDKRKTYEHYDEKLGELIKERNEKISKGNKISSDFEEKFDRNVGKFRDATKEYVNSSNINYKRMSLFMDARYDNISTVLASLCEFEKNFADKYYFIMNFFKNVNNNALSLKPTLKPESNINNYDAANFIRGKELLGLSETKETQNNNLNNYNNLQKCQTIPNPFTGGINNNIVSPNYNKTNSFHLNQNPYDNSNQQINNTNHNQNPYCNNSGSNPYDNIGRNEGNSNSNQYDNSNINSNPYNSNLNNNPYDSNNSLYNNNCNPYNNPYGSSSNSYDNINDNNPYNK